MRGAWRVQALCLMSLSRRGSRASTWSPGRPMPWTDVVIAISTASIAILLAFPAFASFLFIRELGRAVALLERSAATLEKEIMPAIRSARGVMEQARQAAGTVRTEVDAVVNTSQDLRGRVKRAADAAEMRLT